MCKQNINDIAWKWEENLNTSKCWKKSFWMRDLAYLFVHFHWSPSVRSEHFSPIHYYWNLWYCLTMLLLGNYHTWSYLYLFFRLMASAIQVTCCCLFKEEKEENKKENQTESNQIVLKLAINVEFGMWNVFYWIQLII